MAEPSANAYFFVIDAGVKKYDAFFDLSIIGNDCYGDVRYRQQGTVDAWAFLPAVTEGGSAGDMEFDAGRMLTKDTTDAEIKSVLEAFNRAIKKVFGDSSTAIPEKGKERVTWVLKNNAITESNNVLTYTKPN
jgi:hypothetical protein